MDYAMTLYQVINTSNEALMADMGVSYLEALAETLQNLRYEQKAQQIDNLPSDKVVKQLNKLYNTISIKKMARGDIRKAIQLSLLQAIKVDNIQPNHHITPDTIAFFIAFIIEHLMKAPIRLFDPCAGTGNLVSVVHEQLQHRVDRVELGEIDDLLIAILAMGTQLQGQEYVINHQDSVLPLLWETPNVIVSDLPIGFYPYDEKVSDFKVGVSSGHTFAHHALIENSLAILEPNGWGVYLVPANLFESNQAPQILQLLTKDDYYLQSFLTLPETLFKSKTAQKAILIVQKKGDKAKLASEVLIGQVPSFKDPIAFKNFMQTFNDWSKTLQVD